ncbi:MAG: hypothetical protein J0H66_10180 [Solirubrobacterales bacterium]|nr:hypothetical protein [Solirubrobacterales bacterium]OJU93708.1 MAG: hypothetical protein BGO23_13860 [Solirubrobacterales bacterium 67-14]
MPPKPEQTEQQPGADRFWGQFSQSKAGRSTAGEEAGPEAGGASDPGQGGQPGHGDCLEWCPICRSAELFRNTVSPELRQQAESIQHEAIGVLKAFLDAYADKAGGEPGAPAAGHDPEEPPTPKVTDIPLD